MSVADLKYPRKSHRKYVFIPDKSSDLAEFLGIIFGDGDIHNPWQITISLKSITELDYSLYITNLVQELFSIQLAITKRQNENCLKLTISSTTLVEFITSVGMVRGNKVKQELTIPAWIRDNSDYLKSFIRGLFDTDGCTYIDKHTYNTKVYRHLGVAWTSHSNPLLSDVYNGLVILGYTPTTSTK